MKKILPFLVAIIAVIAITLTGCSVNDKKYFDTISSYSFWDNKGEESIAQYKIYEMMDTFLSDGKLEGGKIIGSDGKSKKVMFLGWDGVRADAMANIFHDKNSFDTNGYNYQQDQFSGLHLLKNQGGLYLAYAGGEKGVDSEQSSSTCAGWTSILTGGWNTLHGVKDNNNIKKAEVDTIMMKYAKKGVPTGLAFDWGQLFDLTLKEEVTQIINNSYPIKYCDFDRPIATNNADIMKNEESKKEDQILASSLAHYNAVANDNIPENFLYDIAARDYLLGRIDSGDVFAGGIFHRPDTNGHTTGFSNSNNNYVNSVRNADSYLYQILQRISERELEFNEDWLVIVTADHGGSGNGHGEQVYEHRSTFLATNKKVDSKFFGKGYDGYRENK